MTFSRSPRRAFDAALRPRAFPLKPQPATGPPDSYPTGPTPAGADELMLDQLLNKHLQLWAHVASDEEQTPGVAGVPGVAAQWRRPTKDQ